MNQKKSMYKLLILVLLMSCFCVNAQEQNHDFSIGIRTGFGSEFKNRNYSFTNNYYKLVLNYNLKSTKNFSYEVVVQPEVNFGTHQLLNFYFVTPDEENYIERRERFTKLKDINQYILNIGFLVRKPIYKYFSVFAQASVGPMISDVETERLSKGFAFSDVFAIGLSFELNNFKIEVSPNVRHVSNASLQSSNAGFNTKNIEFGIQYKL